MWGEARYQNTLNWSSLEMSVSSFELFRAQSECAETHTSLGDDDGLVLAARYHYRVIINEVST